MKLLWNLYRNHLNQNDWFLLDVACENIRFSSLFATGDVSQGGTSATQLQKFDTDDANQCLHNKSSSHGVLNVNLSILNMRLLVDFGKCCVHLPTSSSKTPMLLLEKTIFHKIYIDCFVRNSSCLHSTFVAFCLLSVIRKQQLKQCNYSVDQSALLTGFRTDFASSVWNFCCWVADVPPCETSPSAKSEEKRMFSQAKLDGIW